MRSGSVPPFPISKSTPAGTTTASPGRALPRRPSTLTSALPFRTTNTSSRVSECGVTGVPGSISTVQTAVSALPRLGVASEVKRVPGSSWVGPGGAGTTVMATILSSTWLTKVCRTAGTLVNFVDGFFRRGALGSIRGTQRVDGGGPPARQAGRVGGAVPRVRRAGRGVRTVPLRGRQDHDHLQGRPARLRRRPADRAGPGRVPGPAADGRGPADPAGHAVHEAAVHPPVPDHRAGAARRRLRRVGPRGLRSGSGRTPRSDPGRLAG